MWQAKVLHPRHARFHAAQKDNISVVLYHGSSTEVCYKLLRASHRQLGTGSGSLTTPRCLGRLDA